MARKSEFVLAKNQAEAEFVHLCDPGKRPYAQVEEVSEELRIVSCPLCSHKEFHQFHQGRAAAPKISLRLITPHAGGRTARVDLRVRPAVKERARQLARRGNMSVDDLFENLILAA